jgi:hypothetical protein
MMAGAAEIFPIKLTKAVIMKSREKVVRTSATEISDSAVKSGERGMGPVFERNNIIFII